MLNYICPECGADLQGDFDEDVHCEKCNVTYTTQWDYYGPEYDIGCAITGVKTEPGTV